MMNILLLLLAEEGKFCSKFSYMILQSVSDTTNKSQTLTPNFKDILEFFCPLVKTSELVFKQKVRG